MANERDAKPVPPPPPTPPKPGPPPPPGGKKAGPGRQPPPPPPKSSKKSNLLLIWGLGFVIVALLLCAAAALYVMQAGTPELPEKPPEEPPAVNLAGQTFALDGYVPIDIENEWVYQVTRVLEPGKETRKYTSYKPAPAGGMAWTEVDGGRISQGLRSEQGEFLAKATDRSFIPPIHLFKDPMTVGDRLRTPSHVQRTQSAQDRVFTCVVDAVVDAATPAGAFEHCLQVSYYIDIRADSGGLGTLGWRAWYAKGVGVVKKITYAADGTVIEERILVSAVVDGRNLP